MSERFVEAADPADAFAALSDPKRVDILQALWETDEQTAPFSELCDAVEMADSGQFNYHLDKLTGRFVRKTDEGYKLTHAGRNVVGSLLVGTYTETGTLDPIRLDEPCPFCGGTSTFHYENEHVRIACDDCPVTTKFDVSPGVFAGYDTEEVPAVARRYVRLLIRKANNGFCSLCDGRVEPEVRETAEMQSEDISFPVVRYECERCEDEVLTELGTALAEEPVVVAFFQDHGIDVRDASLSRFVAGEEHTTVRQRDPLEIAVEFDCEGETLTVVVDERLSVQSTERT